MLTAVWASRASETSLRVSGSTAPRRRALRRPRDQRANHRRSSMFRVTIRNPTAPHRRLLLAALVSGASLLGVAPSQALALPDASCATRTSTVNTGFQSYVLQEG